MAMSKKKKFLIFGSAGLLVAALVIANLMSGGDEQTLVQSDLAYVDDLSEIVTASGRIQPQTRVNITSQVSAEIVELYINEGDRVMKGDLLLQLDTIQLKADFAQSRFSLDEISARAEGAKTSYERDKLEFERQGRLYEQKLTSETAFTNSKFAFENSRANYNAMQAQQKTGAARLEKSRDALSKTKVIAPMEGVITFLSAEVGEIAQAQTSFTQGKTLMTVSDLSVFEVEVDVDESEIAKLVLGQKSDIRVDAFRDTIYKGDVVEISNSASISGQGTEDYSTNFRVKVRFAEQNLGVRPGMSATVDITTARDEDAILIPYASVVTREFDPDSLANKKTEADSGGLVQNAYAATADESSEEMIVTKAKRKKKEKIKKTGVFIVKDGKAEFVEITTGLANQLHIVALTGLQPSDTIISGSFKTLRSLKEGDAVKIDERSMEKMEEDN